MKTFCEYCRKEVEYRTTAKLATKEIKGKDFVVAETNPYCMECGRDIYVSDIADQNLRNLEEQFYDKILLRHKQGYIVTTEHLISIDFVNKTVTYILIKDTQVILKSDNFKEFEEIHINIIGEPNE